ncbi:MAG: putative peptidoglycan glycosyltransferase FtsW [Pelolinea sp.]|nr:putative peptidoglycan glycosyltransferase FtsW [Pelolinea sp.]
MSPKSIAVDQNKKRRPLNLGVDVSLLVVVITLLTFGLLMLYSASWQYAVSIMGQKPSYLLERQVRFVIIGGLAAVIAFFFDYHKIKKFVIPGMVLTLIMLLLVIFYVNEVRLGARRGLFQGSIQPSEMAKLVIIIYLSFWLFSKQKLLHHFYFGMLPMAAILGIASALILLQPDLSAAITIFVIGGLMFFIAGGEMRQIIPALLISLVVGLFFVFFYSTGKERITSFILGMQDPELASYHLIRSFEAIVNGGIFGVGIGRANTKFTGLPVAPTDSIFSVIVEETGIVGAAFVIILFVTFLWRGLTIAKNSPDLLGRLLAGGISIWIFMEAFINMSVLVNLLPFAGNALPFISYGGSNLTVVLAGVGIIMSVARQTAIKTNQEEGRPLNAVVSMRRDDGWRNVSRSRRPSSSEK